MTCQSCLRALQRASQAEYREGCMGCAVRELVHMEPEARARELDRVEKEIGRAMRWQVTRMVREEAARIKALRQRAVMA